MEASELQKILNQHLLWLKNDPEGKRADLSEANLCRANLSGANLTGANLGWSNLTGANLSGANLSGANLTGANLTGANLSGADMSSITLCRATIDGAILRDEDIGGPGHILCALTDEEWEWVQAHRAKGNSDETEQTSASDETR